jgi:hypothetical protein
MSSTNETIEQQLSHASIAIGNALAEPSLAQALAGFGYSTERLRQGSALCENAQTLYQRQKSAYGDAQTANDAYAAALELAQATYMRYLKVARVALEGERGSLQKLGLAGERKRTRAAQLAQARQFYANALFDPAILARLTAFGMSQSMLVAGQRQFEAAAQADATRRQRQGTAQYATRERNAALAALASWMHDFRQVARVALRDKPQLLHMLGANPQSARRAAHPLPATLASQAAPLPNGQLPAAEQPAAKRNGTTLAAVSE